MKITALVVTSALFLCTRASFARVLEMDLFGLSIHLHGSYNKSPRKFDSAGVYVFNPGFGVGLDFREGALDDGFSGVVKGGFFQDCNNTPLYYATGGLRYVYAFYKDYSLGGSVSLGLMNGENWWTKSRSYSLMPLPILEIGKGIEDKNLAKIGVVYAPHNSAMSSTSGGGLLFLMLSYGSPIS